MDRHLGKEAQARARSHLIRCCGPPVGPCQGQGAIDAAQSVQHLSAMPCPLRFVLVGASAVVAILAVVYTRHSSEEGTDKGANSSKKVTWQLASPAPP